MLNLCGMTNIFQRFKKKRSFVLKGSKGKDNRKSFRNNNNNNKKTQKESAMREDEAGSKKNK